MVGWATSQLEPTLPAAVQHLVGATWPVIFDGMYIKCAKTGAMIPSHLCYAAPDMLPLLCYLAEV